MTINKLQSQAKKALLAGGCFWCLDAAYSMVSGITKVTSGYSGGEIPNPTYEKVLTGKTGYVESVLLEFDPKKISFEAILDIFFSIHDPTTFNRQGNDVGPQYRSTIFYFDDEQKNMAIKKIKDLEIEKIYADKIITEIVPFRNFYPAERYHQKYFEKNTDMAYCQLVISPKILKLREKFHKCLK